MKKVALCLGAFLLVACANIPNLEKNEKISNISNISIKNSSQDFDLTFHSEKWWLVLMIVL